MIDWSSRKVTTPLLGKTYVAKDAANTGWFMVLGKNSEQVFICGVFHDIWSMSKVPKRFREFNAASIARQKFSSEYERALGPDHPKPQARFDRRVLELWSKIDGQDIEA